jgi:AraC-like DNA-binding protein
VSAIEDLLMPNAYLRLIALATDEPEKLVRGTGLSVAQLLATDTPVTVRQTLASMRNEASLRARPDSHHRWATAFAEHFHGPLTAAWLTAPTLGDGVDVFVRFIPDRVPYLAWRASPGERHFGVEVHPLIDLRELRTTLIEVPLLVLARYVRTMRAGATPGLTIELMHQPLVSPDVYRERFQCDFKFGAPQDAVVFPSRWRATPNPGHDPVIWKVAARRCEETSLVAGGLAIVTVVTRELHDAFERANGERTPPTVEEMARRLNVSVRTLHRRLRAAQVSYQQMLDDVRQDFARQLLASGQHGLKHIAAELGYESAASFVRAYKRWHATTPGVLRRRAH